MANTVSSLSYANTFGDWMVATNDLVIENNILAKENYVKDSGTLYLSESSQTALQSNGNVIVQKVLSVQGIGSSATIQNNLDVQGQAYFTNGTLSIATTGNANVGKTLHVLGTDNALIVSNNAVIGGNVAISYATITRTLQSNNTVNTSYASVYNTLFTNKVQANTSVLTDVLVSNNSTYTNYLQANTNVLTAALHANDQISTTTASVTGTTYTNVLQANNSTNTSNATIVWTVYANNVQAHATVNTRTASITGTTFTNNLQANTQANTQTLSVTETAYVNLLQANSVVNTRTMSVTGTTHTGVLQANTLANTETMTVTGNTYTNVLQANTLANTETMTVTGVTYTDVLQANSAANTRTMSVTGITHTDVLQANSAANTRTMSVTGTTHTNVLQANTLANTQTMTVTGTTHTNVLQANTLANTQTMTVTGVTHTDVLQANSAANTRTMSVTGTTHTNILIANTLSRTVNAWASDTTRANTIYANNIVWTPNITITNLIDANDASAFFNSLEVENNLSIGGNFVINGTTVYNTNQFTLSAGSQNQTSYYSVYRTNNALQLANSVYANAQIRWNEAQDYFDIKDVETGDYYRIITEQQVSGSTTSVSSTIAASSAAANTLNNAIQTANTFLKSRIDSSDSFANGAFARANSAASFANGAFMAANSAADFANGAFAAANNVAPQIAPAFGHANAAFAKANAATAEIKGTTGSISPTNASLTFTSNNGVQIYATGANTLAISTSQDLRTTATPTFASLSLTTTPLAASSGGTGTTSLASAFNALVANATGTQSGTAGYVLATGGTGNFYWTSAPSGGGGGATPGTRITSTRLSSTGDGTKTLYDTPTFDQANQVRAYINGVRQFESEYTLNSGTSKLTFATAPVSGDRVLIEVDGYTTYAYYANNIAYGPVTGSIPSSANTIQLAIDDLESRKMPKIGGTFTGDVIGLTMPTATSNTSFATTAFVNNLANSSYTFSHSITGNAGTVTNGLYSTGSYANPAWITSLNADKLSGGTISGSILGNSTVYIGTTAIALNRASAGSHTLNGVSIDGNAGTVGSLGINTIHTNAEANKLVRTDSTGNTIIKTIVSSTHDKIAATPIYVMASNSTGAFANVTSYQTAYLRVSYADTAGSAPASDVYTWAKAATKPSYTKAEVGLGSVDNTADSTKSVSYAATAGRAYPRRSDGGDLNFYWSGQTGQPTWLWGGTDGANMYVYNPSNFSVNYAATAGSAPANGGTSAAVTINYNNDSNSNYQVLWGSGNNVYGTAGIYVNPYYDSLYTTGNITAYASDMRLKGNIKTIQNALYKVCQISGVTYDWNKNTKDLGFIPSLESETGVLAQEIEKIIPDAVSIAPFDRDENGNSKSGENYLTVNYEKIIPLLIEAIKELKAEVETLKGQIK